VTSSNDEIVDGATPLDPDEQDGLKLEARTRGDLNQLEALNIRRGTDWAGRSRNFDPFSVDDLRELHRRMFGNVRDWAGAFRTTMKSPSPISGNAVPAAMRDFVLNFQTQYASSDRSEQSLDEMAARYHHELVRIHPWANGNGRHARLATDLLLRRVGRPPFTWGSGNLLEAAAARRAYLAALRAADAHDLTLLYQFVRS
jgi:Fic-DOC domain mobile mystery protein B